MLCPRVSRWDEAVVDVLCVLRTTVFGVELFCCERLSSKSLDVDGQGSKARSMVPFPLLGLESDGVTTGGPRLARG